MRTQQMTFMSDRPCQHQRCWAMRFAAMLPHITILLTLSGSRLTADEVTRWNEVTGKASFASGLHDHPLFDSRVYAMTFAAVHDALNAIDRRYRPYLLEGVQIRVRRLKQR